MWICVGRNSETQEKRKGAFGIFIFCCVWSKKYFCGIEDGKAADASMQLKHVLATFPEKVLAECPEYFRRAARKWKADCERELWETGEVSDELYCHNEQEMRLLLSKYLLKEAVQSSFQWLITEKEARDYSSVLWLLTPCGGGKKEMLDYFRELKRGIEEGRSVMAPVEAEDEI
ncbi:MAG: hypothetical protein ACLSCR_03605 [Akkermansia sp.]